MTETNKTCTVQSAINGVCGKPAVYCEKSSFTNDEFCECEEHAAYAGSLYNTRHLKRNAGTNEFQVGDMVQYVAYGRTKIGKVVRLGRKNADVTVTLQDGRHKVLKNKPITELKLFKL